MAQTLSPQGPETGRISQILPTIKCSTCSQPIPIADLEIHVCATPPSMPAASAKPPLSPTSASFFQQKYQKLISSRPSTPQASPVPPPAATTASPAVPVKPPPRSSSASPSPLRTVQTTSPISPKEGPGPSPLSRRSPSPGPRAQSPAARTVSTASSGSLGVPRPDRVPSPLARGSTSDTAKVAFPTGPGPSEPRERSPSPLSPRHHASEPTRVSSPMSVSSRTSSEPARYMSPAPLVSRAPSPGAASILRQQQQQRTQQQGPANVMPLAPPARAPSSASTRPGEMGVRHPVQSSPDPFIAVPVAGTNGPSAALAASQRPRAATNVEHGNLVPPPPDPGLDIIYSTPQRPMPPPSAMRGPPLNLDMRMAPPMNAPMTPYSPAGLQVGGVVSPIEGTSHRVHVEIDTKTGGEAGMAGVGRRGFAAAARAAMFAHQMGVHNSSPQSEHFPLMAHVPGMDGRRANAPHYLDISSATNYSSAGTPPLSPGSTVSPRSPFSQQSPLSATSSPLRDGRTSTTPRRPSIARTPSPMENGGMILRDRIIPPAPEPPKTPLPATPSTPSMPFFEKFKSKAPSPIMIPSPVETSVKSSPPAEMKEPMSPAESEFEGLAYADSTDDEDDNKTEAGPSSQPAATPSVSQNKVRFPSLSFKRQSAIKSESKYSSGSSSSTESPRLPMRSLSQSTATTSYTVRSMAKSTGALDRAMETLFEEDPTSPTASSVSSPAMFAAALAADNSQRDSMGRPKLPTRANTTPGVNSHSKPDIRHLPGKRKVAVKKIRTCLKCEKDIDDGRWIQTEGSGVMCDKCWKNMYLPKCRRCNLTIEKQAVSSSDGQLKGKYHRDCFNCHTCHKPFPDKTFYVFDGKPFCAYHYHETNNSLCAAATCGQPIEGPCAVSHTGDRYHPEHLLCEHPRCTEKLVDYWEVDGQMFCDKHAQNLDQEEEEEHLPVPRIENQRDSMSRATKRKTRFIDLKGIGSGI